jgi:hypothetical protein
LSLFFSLTLTDGTVFPSGCHAAVVITPRYKEVPVVRIAPTRLLDEVRKVVPDAYRDRNNNIVVGFTRQITH